MHTLGRILMIGSLVYDNKPVVRDAAHVEARQRLAVKSATPNTRRQCLLPTVDTNINRKGVRVCGSLCCVACCVAEVRYCIGNTLHYIPVDTTLVRKR